MKVKIKINWTMVSISTMVAIILGFIVSSFLVSNYIKEIDRQMEGRDSIIYQLTSHSTVDSMLGFKVVDSVLMIRFLRDSNNTIISYGELLDKYMELTDSLDVYQAVVEKTMGVYGYRYEMSKDSMGNFCLTFILPRIEKHIVVAR